MFLRLPLRLSSAVGRAPVRPSRMPRRCRASRSCTRSGRGRGSPSRLGGAGSGGLVGEVVARRAVREPRRRRDGVGRRVGRHGRVVGPGCVGGPGRRRPPGRRGAGNPARQAVHVVVGARRRGRRGHGAVGPGGMHRTRRRGWRAVGRAVVGGGARRSSAAGAGGRSPRRGRKTRAATSIGGSGAPRAGRVDGRRRRGLGARGDGFGCGRLGRHGRDRLVRRRAGSQRLGGPGLGDPGLARARIGIGRRGRAGARRRAGGRRPGRRTPRRSSLAHGDVVVLHDGLGNDVVGRRGGPSGLALRRFARLAQPGQHLGRQRDDGGDATVSAPRRSCTTDAVAGGEVTDDVQAERPRQRQAGRRRSRQQRVRRHETVVGPCRCPRR